MKKSQTLTHAINNPEIQRALRQLETSVVNARETVIVHDSRLTIVEVGVASTSVDLTALETVVATKVDGSGTIGTIPKFTAAKTLGDSIITQSGSSVAIDGGLNVTRGIQQLDGGFSNQFAGNTGFIGAAAFDGPVTANDTVTLSTLTEGSVPFAGPGGLVSQDNANLFWNDALDQFLVTSASTSPIFAVTSASGGPIGLRNTNAAGFCDTYYQDEGSVTRCAVGFTNASNGDASRANSANIWWHKDKEFHFVRGPTGGPHIVVAKFDTGGTLCLNGAGSVDTLQALNTATGQTASLAAVLGNPTGSWDTTSGAKHAAAIHGSSTGTRSAGASVLRNTGVRANAQNGTENWAIWAQNGDVRLNTDSGITAIGATFTPDPNAKVHVHTAASGAVAAIAGSAMVLEGSGSTYLTIKSPTGFGKGILFNNPTGAADGGIVYDILARGLQFRTAGNVTRMSISSGGNVAITGDLAADGSCTLGNAVGDTHTINGTLDCNHAVNIDGALTCTSTVTVSGNAAFNGNTRIGNANTDLVGFYTTAGVAQQSLTALTDNSGGTANNTVQALTDPADSPVDADALRDDLVANLIPELRNNIADLTAKVNALRTVLLNLGLVA